MAQSLPFFNKEFQHEFSKLANSRLNADSCQIDIMLYRHYTVVPPLIYYFHFFRTQWQNRLTFLQIKIINIVSKVIVYYDSPAINMLYFSIWLSLPPPPPCDKILRTALPLSMTILCSVILKYLLHFLQGNPRELCLPR